MINKILEIISSNKPGESVEPDTKLVESGLLDSFDLLVLVSEIEKEFNVSIPGEMLTPEMFDTPKSILEMVESL